MLARSINLTIGYTNIGNYARSKVFKKHISKLNLSEMKNILDLGCGFGDNAIMLSQALPGSTITGLDIDNSALPRVRFAKNKLNIPNLKLHEGKIDTLKESEFDLIYSVDVFEHIPENEMPFADAYKKLKKGGFMMVKMPNRKQSTIFPDKYFAEHNEWLDHEHPGQVYFLEDLEYRFKKEGFRILFAEQTDGKFSRLAWELAYFAKKGGNLVQLLSLPFCKLLAAFDLHVCPNVCKNGNAITAIGQNL
ncbi:MAG: class I SAM-dependent methyltransferase [Bacteroidia bacterium]